MNFQRSEERQEKSPPRAPLSWVGGKSADEEHMGTRAKKMKEKPRKYVCAKCGEPVNPSRCWIGNEGLICKRHPLVWRVQKGQGDGEESPQNGQ